MVRCNKRRTTVIGAITGIVFLVLMWSPEQLTFLHQSVELPQDHRESHAHDHSEHNHSEHDHSEHDHDGHGHSHNEHEQRVTAENGTATTTTAESMSLAGATPSPTYGEDLGEVVTITSVQPNYKMFIHTKHSDVYISRSVRTGQAWDGDKLRDLKQLFEGGGNRNQAVLVDIGANIGPLSLYGAALGHKVHGVEPMPHNAQLLERSIAANQFENLFTLHKTALSDSKGPDLCFFSDPHNQGHSYASGVDHVHNPNEKCTHVPVTTLDELLANEDKIMVMKLDVEGYEPLVLKGAQQLLTNPNRAPCHIWLEMFPKMIRGAKQDPVALLTGLEDLGYDLDLLPKDNYAAPTEQRMSAIRNLVERCGRPSPNDLCDIKAQRRQLAECMARF